LRDQIVPLVTHIDAVASTAEPDKQQPA